MSIRVVLGQDLREANELEAAENRELFGKHGIVVLNLIGAPGAGKTSLLEKTISALKTDFHLGVLEGDIYTTRDAERIAKCGVEVVQINTRGACHLDASLVRKAALQLPLKELDAILVENVGNLVCPAEFDIGETAKVAVLSVAEGDDKVEKYPLVFRESKAVLINKMDLLPLMDGFDLGRMERELKQVNGSLRVFKVSTRTGEGLEEWYSWVRELVRESKRV